MGFLGHSAKEEKKRRTYDALYDALEEDRLSLVVGVFHLGGRDRFAIVREGFLLAAAGIMYLERSRTEEGGDIRLVNR